MNLGSTQVHAKTIKHSHKQNAANKSGASKPQSSAEETSAERDRRLYRECKGMHNAGACLGYTR